MKKFAFALAMLMVISALSFLSGCSAPPKVELSIISGSENSELEPLLADFTKSTGIKLNMTYKGSVDIMNELKAGAADYDAVWPANSIWISMGDTGKIVRNAKSIMASPVVFGIKKSLAQSLGFVGRDVSVKDILAATKAGKLSFAMTSATQSNSGACAYLGFLSAMLGKNTPVTSEDLQNPDLRASIKELLSGVNRSSGSSDWLKDLIVSAGPLDVLDAMVNYETLVIAANKELVAQGREPLYVVYPYDGMSLADSPLGYVDHGDDQKAAAFDKLQSYLLSPDIQKKLNGYGRRTGITLTVDNPDPSVWNTDWGIDPARTLSFITLPESDVILEALNLYQTALRKPSATVYCLDFSGSMDGDGNQQMLRALSTVLDQTTAANYMLQNSPDDYTAVVAFSDTILGTKEINGNDPAQMQALYNWVKSLSPNGGTDIYSPAVKGLEMLSALGSSYMKAVVLLTDGQSNTGMSADQFAQYVSQNETTIPVFSIMFGDADNSQLGAIATETKAKVFDGRTDIISAFKQVRGYN